MVETLACIQVLVLGVSMAVYLVSKFVLFQ